MPGQTYEDLVENHKNAFGVSSIDRTVNVESIGSINFSKALAKQSQYSFELEVEGAIKIEAFPGNLLAMASDFIDDLGCPMHFPYPLAESLFMLKNIKDPFKHDSEMFFDSLFSAVKELATKGKSIKPKYQALLKSKRQYDEFLIKHKRKDFIAKNPYIMLEIVRVLNPKKKTKAYSGLCDDVYGRQLIFKQVESMEDKSDDEIDSYCKKLSNEIKGEIVKYDSTHQAICVNCMVLFYNPKAYFKTKDLRSIGFDEKMVQNLDKNPVTVIKSNDTIISNKKLLRTLNQDQIKKLEKRNLIYYSIRFSIFTTIFYVIGFFLFTTMFNKFLFVLVTIKFFYIGFMALYKEYLRTQIV